MSVSANQWHGWQRHRWLWPLDDYLANRDQPGALTMITQGEVRMRESDCFGEAKTLRDIEAMVLRGDWTGATAELWQLCATRRAESVAADYWYHMNRQPPSFY